VQRCVRERATATATGTVRENDPNKTLHKSREGERERERKREREITRDGAESNSRELSSMSVRSAQRTQSKMQFTKTTTENCKRWKDEFRDLELFRYFNLLGQVLSE
jgi:hypothetical protein